MFKKVYVLLCYSLVFLSFLLLSPAQAISQECEIDYNRPTIAGGYFCTVGLKEDGTVVWTSGWHDLSSWTNIKAVAAGWFHTVGLKEDGTLVGTGWTGYGHLNFADWTNIRQPSCLGPPPLNGLTRLLQILQTPHILAQDNSRMPF